MTDEMLILSDARPLVDGTKTQLSFNLKLRPGQICAVQGSNDSGKTILMMSVCGLVDMEGTVRLYMHDLTTPDGRKSLRGHAVYVPEDLSGFFLGSTVTEELELSARLLELRGVGLDEAIKKAIENLPPTILPEMSINTLNREQALQLIMAILGMMKPWLVAWDGAHRQLDTSNRKAFQVGINELSASGTMILISCLLPDEVDSADLLYSLETGDDHTI